MKNVQMKILDQRLTDGTFDFPAYQSEGAAGLDLCACLDQDAVIYPGQTTLISTGISIFLDDHRYAAMILPRSSIGHKRGLVLGNLVGLVDSDYQGPLMVSLWNRNAPGHAPVAVVKPGERIAQLVIVPVLRPLFDLVSEFRIGTVRGAGGFGSTDAKRDDYRPAVWNVTEGDQDYELAP